MNLLVPVPAWLFWSCGVVATGVALWAALTAPWRKLWAVSIRQHLWYGSILAFALIWTFLAVDVDGVFKLHPMMITTFVLVFGARLALVLATLTLLLTTAMSGASWQGLGFTWVVSILGPTVITLLLLRAVMRTRIQNLFLYTLGIGFLGGILSSFAIGVATVTGLWLGGADYFRTVWTHGYLFLMFAFPEGFCNGYLVSALAIMAPQLIKTFDEDFFLQ